VAARDAAGDLCHVFLGSSEALAARGELAALVIDGLSDTNGIVTVGAYRADGGSGAIIDVPNVSVRVRALTLGGVDGTEVLAGVYTQANQAELDGYVVFNNASSRLIVPHPVGTVIVFR
jgi:hypothetical protein